MKFITAFILLLVGSLTDAQDNFLAYRVTGKVTYQDKVNQVPLKVGRILDKTVTVKVGQNASLLLICGNSTTALELKEGTHSLGKLVSSCHSSTESLTSNYLNYVWWQLTHPATIEDERKKNMSGAGAASRGCPGVEFMVPDTIAFFRENVTLKWKIDVSFKTREFVLFEYADSPVPLLKIPLKSGYLHLDSLEDKLEPSREYFWTLRLDGKESCPRKVLQVWSPEDFALLNDSININQPPGLDMAERNYMTGWVYEQNHLTGEAIRYYKLAAKASPGNNRYKRTVKRLGS